MYWANLWRFILLALLCMAVVVDCATMIMLYGILFFLGTIETFFEKTAQTIMPVIVPVEELEEAKGRLFAKGSIASELVGPPLGSAAFSMMKSTSFLVASIAQGLSSFLIYRMPSGYSTSAQGQRRSMYQEIHEGVSWLWQQRL